MFFPFNQLPDSSRIWIYQANRVLTSDEIRKIKISAEKFIKEWTAHNQALRAGFEIFHHLFLILAVDENQNDASGCSIDKSVHFIRKLEKEFTVSLLDRMNVAYRLNDSVEVKPLDSFLAFFKKENLPESLPVFNNLIRIKGELSTGWQIPLSESWISQKRVQR